MFFLVFWEYDIVPIVYRLDFSGQGIELMAGLLPAGRIEVISSDQFDVRVPPQGQTTGGGHGFSDLTATKAELAGYIGEVNVGSDR